jgi:hypothetical protein
MFGLENCDEPFKTPSALNIQPRAMCRVSYFDDISERSVSCRSSFDNGTLLENERAFQVVTLKVTRTKTTSISEAPEPLPRDFSGASTLLGEFQQSDRHGLCSKQSFPLYKFFCAGRPSRRLQSDYRRLSHVGCSIALNSMAFQSQKSPGLSLESSASDTCGASSRSKGQWKASPGSSISSSSRRSPLSTVRYVNHVFL